MKSRTKKHKSVGAIDAMLGSESWWKRALVVAGVVYINGYLAFRAFSASLGLSPTDFAMSHEDYLIQGILYLLPEYHSLVHPRLEFWRYYSCVAGGWIALWLSLQLAFFWAVGSSLRSRIFHTSMLAFLGVGIAILGTYHGRQRATMMRTLAENFQSVTVEYSVGDNKSSVIAGRLVIRTDKILCLTKVSDWLLGSAKMLDPGDIDNRFFVIPMEKIQTVILK